MGELSQMPTRNTAAKLTDFAEIRPIGAGTFAKVVLVKHLQSGEHFAMKIIDKKRYEAQKITHKAHSEEYILKTTHHLFIVSLFYSFEVAASWHVVMEYCPNGDLQEYLGKYGEPGMSFSDAALFGGEIILAVEHMHTTNVIFRDLKLENVVLDSQWRAKITDFGLAKKLSSLADAVTMCGSYGYAAPEIMRNTGKYTYAVDLYSFGVVLYLMLSGGSTRSEQSKTRLPPSKHGGLMRKLAEAERGQASWAQAEARGLELTRILVSEDPRSRTSATAVKRHSFFKMHLGIDADSLMEYQPECVAAQRSASATSASSASVIST